MCTLAEISTVLGLSNYSFQGLVDLWLHKPSGRKQSRGLSLGWLVSGI